MKPPYQRDGTTGFIDNDGNRQCTGSMMGRSTIIPHDYNGERLHLRRVKLDSGGYDLPGGAYWGLGSPLYCAWGETDTEQVQVFVRAESRVEAKSRIMAMVPAATFKR